MKTYAKADEGFFMHLACKIRGYPLFLISGFSICVIFSFLVVRFCATFYRHRIANVFNSLIQPCMVTAEEVGWERLTVGQCPSFVLILAGSFHCFHQYIEEYHQATIQTISCVIFYLSIPLFIFFCFLVIHESLPL